MNPRIDLYYSAPRLRLKRRVARAIQDFPYVVGCIVFAPIFLVLAGPAVLIAKISAAAKRAIYPRRTQSEWDLASTPIQSEQTKPGVTPRTTSFYGKPSLRSDGSLLAGLSEYSDQGHISGMVVLRPESPEYLLWLWAIANWDELLAAVDPPRFFSNHVMDDVRPRFEEARLAAGSDDGFRDHLLSLIPVTPELTDRERKQLERNRRFDNAIMFAGDSVLEVFIFPLLSPFVWVWDRLFRVRQQDRT